MERQRSALNESVEGRGNQVPGRTHWPVAALMSFVLAVLPAACGDDEGGDDGRGVDPDLEQALVSMTDPQMAVMPLTAQELGEAADLLVSGSPPYATDNSAAADRSPPENDTAADQERAGRISGYARDYYADNDIYAHAEVHLYQDVSSASAALAQLVSEVKGLEGQRQSAYEAEFVIDEVETFIVDALAVEATGLRLRAYQEGSDYQLQTTTVVFNYGRLLIALSENRLDTTDVASQVEQAAQAQLQRIEGVLAGAIVDTPEATPSPITVEPPPLSIGDVPLTPGAEVGFEAPGQSGAGELLYTGLRVEAADFDRERIDFALIGPYSGPLPQDVKIADDSVLESGEKDALEGACPVLRVTSATGETELNLLPGEELVFTVEYACEPGRVAKIVGLYGFIFERP